MKWCYSHMYSNSFISVWNLSVSHLCVSLMYPILLGDGMNAYVAYKVSTRVCNFCCQCKIQHSSFQQLLQQVLVFFVILILTPMYCPYFYHQTSLPMFRNKTFSVRRRFSDFLGLYEKMSVKQSLIGCIIPPPPEKSIMGGSLCLSCVLFQFCGFCRFMCLSSVCVPLCVFGGTDRNDQS